MTINLTPVQSSADLNLAEKLSKHNRPPTEVPGYEPQRWLGGGAFGVVWVANDRNTGRRVAIKFFIHRVGLDWSLLTREVEKLRVLSNDRYVVQLLGVGWDADPPYYIMEYVEGGSLDDFLRQGPLPASEAVPLFREIVVGLVHAHNKGILHCDLKPANILLDQDRRPRLADFGQARLPEEQSPALGTWFYMAPEQADLRAAPDARWDVYALGAVLHCLLTGAPPYRSDELAGELGRLKKLEERLACYRKHLEEAPPPREYRGIPGVDRGLCSILERCLARDRHQRFPNVQAVLNALDARALSRARRPLLVLGVVGPILFLMVTFFSATLLISETVRDARDQLIESAQDGNRLTAKMAAQVVGDRIRHRRHLLELEAKRPKLVELIAAASRENGEGPATRDLQGYIDEQQQRSQRLSIDDNWLILDAQGRLLDVSPLERRQRFREKKVLGNYFWYRDFFHGQGTDFEPQRHTPKPRHLMPIKEYHQSVVFQIGAEVRPLMVAFSVPVKKDEATVGVLAMTRRLGDFSELHAAEDDDRWIALVQTRAQKNIPGAGKGNVSNRGLVLEHPVLRDLLAKKQPIPMVHMDEAALQMMQQPGRSETYQDPFGKDFPDYAGKYLVAFEPVRYPASPSLFHQLDRADVDTGLAIVVQQKYEDAIGPVEELRRKLIVHGLIGLGAVIAVIGSLWGLVAVGFNDSSRSRLTAFLRWRAGLASGGRSGGTGSSRPGSTGGSAGGSGTTPTISLSAPPGKPDMPTPDKDPPRP